MCQDPLDEKEQQSPYREGKRWEKQGSLSWAGTRAGTYVRSHLQLKDPLSEWTTVRESKEGSDVLPPPQLPVDPECPRGAVDLMPAHLADSLPPDHVYEPFSLVLRNGRAGNSGAPGTPPPLS